MDHSEQQQQLPAQLRLADRILEGGLAGYIREQRSAERSWDWMARDLWVRTEREIDINGQTIKRWAELLELEGVA
jgi:hypothetical protein